MNRCINWLIKSQLPGIIIGGAIVFASNYYIELAKQTWTAKSLAAAFAGEISAIIDHQNTTYLKSIQSELEVGKIWNPIDQPAERQFTVYEAAASNLGLLDGKIVADITNFYWLTNEERGKRRILGTSPRGYVSFEVSDKKVFLKQYISLNDQTKRLGQKIIEALRARYGR